MAILERRQAIAVVVARVFRVTHAYPGRVQQADDRSQHLLAGEPLPVEIATDTAPEARQGVAELDHSLELRAVAQEPPFRVVAILLSPTDVAARGLEVAQPIGADPDVLVGRGNRETCDPVEGRRIPYAPAIRVNVREAVALPYAPDSRVRVADVHEPARVRHERRLRHRFGRSFMVGKDAGVFHGDTSRPNTARRGPHKSVGRRTEART